MEQEPELGAAPAAEDVSKAIVDQILEPYKKKEGGYRNVRVYIDLAVNKEPLGRVEIDLLNVDKCPKTYANFIALCRGANVDKAGKNLHYKGSTIFRMVPKFCLCGGDIVNDNGTSGKSVYDKDTFEDEKSGLSHDKPGIVSMLQQAGGPNTNGSQFVILLAAAPWLDKINVPFGLVSSGMDVLERACEKYGAESGKPTSVVRIYDCGVK